MDVDLCASNGFGCIKEMDSLCCIFWTGGDGPNWYGSFATMNGFTIFLNSYQ